MENAAFTCPGSAVLGEWRHWVIETAATYRQKVRGPEARDNPTHSWLHLHVETAALTAAARYSFLALIAKIDYIYLYSSFESKGLSGMNRDTSTGFLGAFIVKLMYDVCYPRIQYKPRELPEAETS
ncbi:hypothetical protein FKM82_022937 [Ascaphus truei]